jgi:hypothetical protein
MQVTGASFLAQPEDFGFAPAVSRSEDVDVSEQAATSCIDFPPDELGWF